MELGKKTILAIIETALFVIGAIFFLIVLIVPANPIWALVAGILCGLTGAIVWSCSFFVHIGRKVGHKLHDSIKSTKVNPEDVAKQILEDDDFKQYKLHRANAYDTITDEIIAQDKQPETTDK